MPPMRDDTPLGVLWRRRWIVIATFLVFAGGTAVVSKTLTKIYSTSSTLLVVPSQQTGTFDAIQAGLVIARTYGDIIASDNIAEQVAARIGGLTKDRVQAAASFEVVSDTQLLKITTEDPSPRRAKAIADTYADVFITYARESLGNTTKAAVALADPAPLPDSPAKPKPTLYTLLAGLLGLGFGVALAFLRERLDFRLHSPEEIESRFELPVLGRVPRRGRSDVSLSAFTEAFRVLRTNLQFAGADRPLRTIAITSGVEGEGKTTTTLQLALATAEIGTDVMLIDADIRRPSLQKAVMPVQPAPLQPGFADYLVGAAPLDDVIHDTPRANLELVPTGSLPDEHLEPGMPPSLARLLETRLGRTAIGGFAASADLVLLDCPPLSVGADASVLAGRVDGVILVIDLEASTERTVRDAVRQLRAVKANVLGLVINRDRTAEPTSGYEYHVGHNRRERVAARS
jgi:capsular exopolysaccharide synthesis family protein